MDSGVIKRRGGSVSAREMEMGSLSSYSGYLVQQFLTTDFPLEGDGRLTKQCPQRSLLQGASRCGQDVLEADVWRRHS